MVEAYLKPGREKAALNRHPWIFGGAIDRIEGQVEDGDIVTVRDARGTFVGRGYLNRRSQIVVRLLTWDEGEPIDSPFWARRIVAAVSHRQSLAADPTTTAYRLIHAEADLLPGLTVDRYNDYLVVQCLTLGIARRQQEILAALLQAMSPAGIYERSDVDVREREGLPPATGTWWLTRRRISPRCSAGPSPGAASTARSPCSGTSPRAPHRGRPPTGRRPWPTWASRTRRWSR